MRTLNDYFLTSTIADISTASSTFVPVPDGGKIIKIITALQGAISGANAGISFEIGGTAVTGGGITVAHSGSAAGTVDTAEPTAANTKIFLESKSSECFKVSPGEKVAVIGSVNLYVTELSE